MKSKFLLGTALGLSMLAGSFNRADAQTKDKDLPLNSRSYSGKVTQILADDVITHEEVAELAYVMRSKQSNNPILKLCSEAELNRAEKDNNVIVIKGANSIKYINREFKNSGKEKAYLQLHREYEKNGKWRKAKENYNVDVKAFCSLFDRLNTDFKKAGLDSTIISLLLSHEGRSSSVLYFQGEDCLNIPPSSLKCPEDEAWSELMHEKGHLEKRHTRDPNRLLLHVSQRHEKQADSLEMVYTNYDLSSVLMGNFSSFKKYKYYKDYTSDSQNKSEKSFVENYSTLLKLNEIRHEESPDIDPHGSDFSRLNIAIRQFNDAMINEQSQENSTNSFEKNVPLLSTPVVNNITNDAKPAPTIKRTAAERPSSARRHIR